MAVYAYRIENVYLTSNRAAADRVSSSAAAASVSGDKSYRLEGGGGGGDLG